METEMEMEHYYYSYLCNREVEYKIYRTIRRTMLPHLKINFNVWSYLEDLRDGDSDDDDEEEEQDSLTTVSYSHSAYVSTSGEIKYEDMREAAGKTMINNPHHDEYDRASIIELMVREVEDIFSSPAGESIVHKHTVCSLEMEVRMKRRWRNHVVEKDEMERLAEAAGCCCICLEEFRCGSGREEGMRMACSHVFHEGCIKEWRRRSSREGRNRREWWRTSWCECECGCECEVEVGRCSRSCSVIKERRRRTSQYYCPICRCEMPLDVFRTRLVNGWVMPESNPNP